MKYEIMNIKRLPVIILIIWFLQADCFSQGTDMGLERHPGVFLGFSAGSLRSQIINTTNLVITQGDAQGTFAGSLDVGYYFSKYFGLKTGIGYTSFETDLTLQSYQNSSYQNDSENENYQLRVSASNLTESQTVNVMKIPLNIILNIPLSPVFSIFAEPGINIVIPVNNSFSSSGSFTYKGYYSSYNVLLENLPAHGFLTNTVIKTDDVLELKNMWNEAVINAGIGLAIKRKFHITVGYCYARSISDISTYESPAGYQLSSSPGEVNSLMGGSEKVTTTAMGFNITLRYFLNR
jgi:hypothetical protein